MDAPHATDGEAGTVPWCCECDSACHLQARIPLAVVRRASDEGLWVILDGCPCGPGPRDELVGRGEGYALYRPA
jgi:hypothetical protein